jgi:hypothetical protein
VDEQSQKTVFRRFKPALRQIRADFLTNPIAGGGGEQDAVAVMAVGEPKAAGLKASNVWGGGVDGGAEAGPNRFGF